MRTFKTFIINEETEETTTLKHITHAEDRPLMHGSEGFEHAHGALMQAHAHMKAKAKSSNLTMKYDGCLHEDTIVLLSNGEEKTIKDIVTSWSLANPVTAVGVDGDKIVHTPIVDYLAANTPKEWVMVEGVSGNILLTDDHQVMTERGWVPSGRLILGDIIRDIGSYK